MDRRRAVRTVLDRAFDLIVPNDASILAMPGEMDIGGGDSAGWGRGLASPSWLEDVGGISVADTAHHRLILWVPGQRPTLLAKTPGAIVGAASDRNGGFVGCDWAGRRVVARQADGSTKTLAESFAGRRFNRPGDICTGPSGVLYFTDQKLPFPPNEPGIETLPDSGVYGLDKGELFDTGIRIDLPGGLSFDAARSRLLVSEPRALRIHAFPVAPDGSVDGSAGTIVATLDGTAKGAPHGLCIDAAGRIHAGGPGGIWVLDPSGAALGIVHLPASRVTGLAIGGGRLWITTPVGAGAIDLAAGIEAPRQDVVAPAILRQPLGFDQLIERHDPAFDRIVPPDAAIANLASGGFFDDLGGGEDELYSRSLEGLYWDSREDCLMFSDIGNSRRMRFTPSTGAITQAHFPTGFTNGATLDHDGNTLSCEHAGRRISRRLPNGERVNVVDRTDDGRRLNHPNDIVIRSDGNIYFTDPWWDFGAGEASEIGHAATWHLDPDRRLHEFGGDWIVCNGLALSLDERILFVNDSYKYHIRAFDLAPDGSVDTSSDRVFCELKGAGDGKPDGMKLDLAGNVYCGGPRGLWVFSPEGRHLGTIVHGATQTNNLCFGGEEWRTLFFCSWISLHSVPLLIPGVRTLDAR